MFSRVFWGYFLPLILLLLIVSVTLSQTQQRLIAEHHKNLVFVRCELGNKYSTGWGVYCQYKGLQGVLTVAHGLERQPNGNSEVTVTFYDGLKLVSPVTVDKYGHDVAFVFATHATLRPVPFSSSVPKVGQQVEWISRRAPSYKLCRAIGTIAQTNNQGIAYTGVYGIVGDSGSPYFNNRQEVIGVHMLGVPSIKSAPPSISTSYRQTTNFLNRLVQGCCPSGNCAVPYSPPATSIKRPTPASRPLVPIKRPNPIITIDYDRIANLVYSKIEENAEKFRGLPGLSGCPGENGVDGKDGTDGVSPTINYDVLTAEVIKRLPPVMMEIHTLDGEVLYQSRPLGESIQIRLLPR